MRPDPSSGSPLRIGYICTDPGVPVFGRKGASIHVQEVVRTLSRAGHRPEIFTCRRGGEAPSGLTDVPVHTLPAPRGPDAAARERQARAFDHVLRQELERLGPFDLIYQRYSLWSDQGMRYASDAGVPSVLEVNAPLVEEQGRHRELCDGEGALEVTRSALRSAHLRVAVSEPVARWIRSIDPNSDGQTLVIPNGVDPRRFELASSPYEIGARSRSRSQDDPFTVGFVGTLKPWHGVEILIRAMARLRDGGRLGGGSDFRLLIVGDGPQRSTLEEEVARRNMAAHVDFTGAVPHAAIPRLLSAMDVAVAPYPAPVDPSDFYFSPLKILEYMAAGLPVVASRFGTIEDIISDRDHGLLVTPGDAGSLAEAILRLTVDPSLRERLGTSARRRIHENFTWDHVVGRILREVRAFKREALVPAGGRL